LELANTCPPIVAFPNTARIAGFCPVNVSEAPAVMVRPLNARTVA
jgi:hypothetical protein